MRRFLALRNYFFTRAVARNALRPFGLRTFRAVNFTSVFYLGIALASVASFLTIVAVIITATLLGLDA